MYLGTLGRLIEVKCPTSLQESRSGGFAFSATLEGKVKAQVLPGGRRVWDVELGQLTTPQDLQVLEQFSHGMWGAGPFVFVSADAPVTNVLHPAAVRVDASAGLLSSNRVDGPLLTPDGWAARSLGHTSGQGTLQFGVSQGVAPVVPGESVTVAAYVLGADARVRLVWVDAAGAIAGSADSSVRATSTEVVRSHITRTAPSNAVGVRVQAASAVQAAWPTVTWTNTLMPVSPGRGCNQAVVHGVSHDVVRATEAQQFYSTGFTVTEVG